MLNQEGALFSARLKLSINLHRGNARIFYMGAAISDSFEQICEFDINSTPLKTAWRIFDAEQAEREVRK